MSNGVKCHYYGVMKGRIILHYKTNGTCSRAIDLEIENDVITACAFEGGCKGNTQGLAKVVVGQNAKDVMERLRGIECRGNTSCPDQLSRAIAKYYQENAQ